MATESPTRKDVASVWQLLIIPATAQGLQHLHRTAAPGRAGEEPTDIGCSSQPWQEQAGCPIVPSPLTMQRLAAMFLPLFLPMQLFC